MAVIQQTRFASVDALRGITVAAMLLVNNPGDWGHVYAPLLHADWHGCTPTDLVFPFFLFIVGVSIALGIVPRVEAGADISLLRRTVLIRAAKIIGLGLALHLLSFLLMDKEWFRPWGVLQRIGLCFAVVGFLALHSKVRLQWAVITGLLLGYWGLLLIGGSFEPWINLASRVDTALLGPLLYQFDPATGLGHDPEGLLSTLPAIATTLLGLRAGDWLRRGRTMRLVCAGLVALVLGLLWSQWFPLNKNLWTSSYAMWAAGWATLLLALCHHLFDVRGWRPFGRSMGINAITAYAGSWVMACVLERFGVFGALYRSVLHPVIGPLLGDKAASLGFAIAFVAFWWLLMWAMAKRGIRISV